MLTVEFEKDLWEILFSKCYSSVFLLEYPYLITARPKDTHTHPANNTVKLVGVCSPALVSHWMQPWRGRQVAVQRARSLCLSQDTGLWVAYRRRYSFSFCDLSDCKQPVKRGRKDSGFPVAHGFSTVPLQGPGPCCWLQSKWGCV